MRKAAVLYLNGKRLEIGPRDAGMMLADFLRYSRGLTGTKIVCAEGDCGACTVLWSFGGFDSDKKKASAAPKFRPINACIVSVAQMDGSSLVTIDALADEDRLTPVQCSMMKCHGSQCGFCTPGFVMALTGLVEKKLCSPDLEKSISAREAKNALTGNLCRCTGYQPILEAATSIEIAKCTSVAERFSSRAQQRELREATSEALALEDGGFRFFAPTSAKDAVKLLAKNPKLRILGAATDLGVAHNKWRERLTEILSLHLIPELYEVRTAKGRVHVGARVTLSQLRVATEEAIPELAKFLDLFASPQIKNFATLVGNVANASPIGDTPPFLLVSDAIVETLGPKGQRSISIDQFFLGYRKTALRKGELITSINFAIPGKNDVLVLKKVSERKDLDISSVNAAINVSWSDARRRRMKSLRLAVGGVAANALRLRKTENYLEGKNSDPEIIEQAIAIMHGEIAPIADLRGSAAFRHVLVENILRRFFAGVSQ